MKVLIAYDGSDSALAAADDLERAGLGPKADVRILAVADVFLAPEAGDGSLPESMRAIARHARARAAAAVKSAGDLAETARAHLKGRFPGWSVESMAAAGSPAWAIVAAADAWSADLVVLGSVGHSLVERLLLGSISQKVLSEASCSVRIGRAPRGSSSPLRLLVGVDGSPPAQAAVRAVAARAWPAGTEVEVVSVVDLKVATALAGFEPAAARWVREEDADETAWVRRMAEEAAELLRKSGLAASLLVREGDPGRVLVDEAERWGAACVFLGATGLSRLERLVLGSVASAVAARARCSVEIARPTAGPPRIRP